MFTVRIGTETRDIGDATENWINEQVNRRRRERQAVCVELVVNTSGLNLRLATAGCGAGGGGSRPPNANESRVLKLWEHRGLSATDLTAGQVIAFLKELRRSIG